MAAMYNPPATTLTPHNIGIQRRPGNVGNVASRAIFLRFYVTVKAKNNYLQITD